MAKKIAKKTPKKAAKKVVKKAKTSVKKASNKAVKKVKKAVKKVKKVVGKATKRSAAKGNTGKKKQKENPVETLFHKVATKIEQVVHDFKDGTLMSGDNGNDSTTGKKSKKK